MKSLAKLYVVALIITVGIIIVSSFAFAAGPTPLQPILGGWGISTTTPANVGYCAYIVSVNPAGVPVYGFTPCGSGAGGSSTSIFAGNAILVVASGTNGYIIINGGVTSTAGNWIGTWQGVNSSTFYLASNPIGFLTSSTGVTTFNGNSGAVNGVSSLNLTYGDLSLVVRASGTVPTIEGGGAPFYINFPAQGSGIYAPSTTIPTSLTPTTTLNGFTGTVFDILGGAGITKGGTNGSTTFSFTNGFGYSSTTINGQINALTFASTSPIGLAVTNGTFTWSCATCLTTSTWVINASGTNIFTNNQGGSSTIWVSSVPTFTSITDSGIISALVLTNGSGVMSGYAGASACSGNGAVTTISALGATTCSTSVGVSTSTPQIWLALQQFVGIASTTQLYSASTTFSDITSALHWGDATGKVKAYGGTGCAGTNAIQTLNSSGTATCVSTGGGGGNTGVVTSTVIFQGGIPYFITGGASSTVQTTADLLYNSGTGIFSSASSSLTKVSSTNLDATNYVRIGGVNAVTSTVTSALRLAGSGGADGAYGGASACAGNGAVTTISATGATTCATSVGVSTSTINNWTATQNFTIASTTQLISASSTLNGLTVMTGSSTIANGLSIGTTTLPSLILNVVGAGTSTIKFGDASSSKPACFMFSQYPTGTSWAYAYIQNFAWVVTSTPCN